jgi:holliday junction DNA helicase RuvA
MIGFLSGQIIHSQNGFSILDINGVGYQISTVKHLKPSSKRTNLFIHTHVKEDEISLFGFETKEELELFKNLISVSGVGPRIALSILASGTDKDIASAIKNSSVDFFSSVPGIGKKTAQKLIIDLKSKLDDSSADLAMLDQDSSLIEGLVGLGFAKKEIHKIASKIKPDLSLAEQIKLALKLLNQ